MCVCIYKSLDIYFSTFNNSERNGEIYNLITRSSFHNILLIRPCLNIQVSYFLAGFVDSFGLTGTNLSF